MAQEIFYIKVETEKATTLYAFTRSATGILDYAGTAQDVDLSNMPCVESSKYFTPSWYTYLPKELLANISVYLPADVADMDTNQYSFLLHIGAILLAVQETDGLLVAELLHRRSMVFANFTPLIMHIVKPVAPEALFAWVYGGFRGESDFKQVYSSNKPISTGETDTAAILLAAARDILKPDPEKESPEEMFARYFREHAGRPLTIGIVGANNHQWIEGVEKIDRISEEAAAYSFIDDPSKAGKKCQDIYAGLQSSVQVEPYNPHDHNAISISIDDPVMVLKGIRSKCKAGYLRATGAAVLRKAYPSKFVYNSKLWRLGANPDYFENSIILRITP